MAATPEPPSMSARRFEPGSLDVADGVTGADDIIGARPSVIPAQAGIQGFAMWATGPKRLSTKPSMPHNRKSPLRLAGKRSMVPADEALKRLREGNARFVAEIGGSGALTGESRRRELATGQQPFAIILGCSDSRVPAEIVFDQGLGDLFVIRVAGNVVAPSQIGSVEFSAEQHGARLVVVLGHTQCGAILATIDQLARPREDQSRGLIPFVAPSLPPTHRRPRLSYRPPPGHGQHLTHFHGDALWDEPDGGSRNYVGAHSDATGTSPRCNARLSRCPSRRPSPARGTMAGCPEQPRWRSARS